MSILLSMYDYFFYFWRGVGLQHLEAVIKARMPGILAMINKMIDDIETELNQIGRPLSNDAGVRMKCFFVLHFLLSNFCEVVGSSVVL